MRTVRPPAFVAGKLGSRHGCLMACLILGCLSAARAGETRPGEHLDTWHGCVRHDFTVDGCPAWVVEPKQAARGDPWTRGMEFPEAFSKVLQAGGLAKKGTLIGISRGGHWLERRHNLGER